MKALIFDVDGTLADTEEAHRRAFNAAFAAAGLDWAWDVETYRNLLRVTGGKERIRAWMNCIGCESRAYSAEDVAALHRDKTARYAALVAGGETPLRPGVADVIAEARAAGLRLAVATTTSRPNVDALCRAAFGAAPEEIFDALACGDEVARKKPDPAVYLLALERLGLAAVDCVAFEDSLNGLRSAKAAGLRVVLTPTAYTAGEDFSGADELLGDLTEWRMLEPA